LFFYFNDFCQPNSTGQIFTRFLPSDLLGRGRVPVSSAIGVETFSRYFEEKVAKVRREPATRHRRRSAKAGLTCLYIDFCRQQPTTSSMESDDCLTSIPPTIPFQHLY